MISPIRAALERLVELDDTVPHNRPGWIQEWFDAIATARTALSAPTRAEGVGELALELELMANRAADDSRLGDAHFLSRAADLLAQRHPAPPAEGDVNPHWQEAAVGRSVTWAEVDSERIRVTIEVLEPCPVGKWRQISRSAIDCLNQYAPVQPEGEVGE